MHDDGPSIEFLPEFGQHDPVADDALHADPPPRLVAVGLAVVIAVLVVVGLLVRHDDPQRSTTAEPAQQPSIPVFTSAQRAPVDVDYPRYPVPGPSGAAACQSCASSRALPAGVEAAVRDAFPNVHLGPALTVRSGGTTDQLVYRRFVAITGAIRVEVEVRERERTGRTGYSLPYGGRVKVALQVTHGLMITVAARGPEAQLPSDEQLDAFAADDRLLQLE